MRIAARRAGEDKVEYPVWEVTVLASLLAFFIIGFFSLIALTVVFALIGVVFSFVFGVASFLLFKVAPLLLIGWLVVKLLQRSGSPHDIAAADRKWLDE